MTNKHFVYIGQPQANVIQLDNQAYFSIFICGFQLPYQTIILKNLFGLCLRYLYFNFKLLTSRLTPVQQLSAAFKAGNSRRAHFMKWQHKESDML